MSLVDQAATSTLPKLLQRNAEQDPKRAGHAREGPRHLADADLARLPRPGARLRARAGRDRVQARRQALRASATTARSSTLRAACGAGPGRHLRAGLPGFDRLASWSTCSNHAETSVIVAEDQEQVDKALSLKDKLPKLRWIIYDDPRGLSFYDDPILRSYRQRAGGGADVRRGQPRLLRRRAGQGRRRRHGDDRLHLGHDRHVPRARCSAIAT